MDNVTQLLRAVGDGNPGTAGQLLPLVYAELRRLAKTREKPGHTLDATALVHEAYLRLVDQNDARAWDNRRHFFAAAAEAMRRILVENARRKKSVKRGGDRRRLDLDENVAGVEPQEELLALDEALTRLSAREPAKAEVVKLRFFAGLTMPQTAQALGISLATAERYWNYARTWLYAELDQTSERPSTRKRM
jgi:RNA polymerase sigma factor (TIGR02999 family)